MAFTLNSRLPSSTAGTNVTQCTTTANQSVYKIIGFNAASKPRYLRFYNVASAPTVGTTPVVMTLHLPPLTGFAFDLDGFKFTAGIFYALTDGVLDGNSVGIGAGDILGLNVGHGP